MLLDEVNHNICIGKNAAQITTAATASTASTTRGKSIVMLANDEAATWTNGSGSVVNLQYDDNSIVLNASTPVNSYSGSDGDDYPIITRTNGGLYIKPIQSDNQLKPHAGISSVAASTSNKLHSHIQQPNGRDYEKTDL